MNISLFKAFALQLQLQLLVEKLFDSSYNKLEKSYAQGRKRCR